LTKKGKDNNLLYSEESFKDLERLPECLLNDLEAVTATKYPEIPRLKRRLIELGAREALMSGSGPTVFGLYNSQVEVAKACKVLKGKLNRRFSIFMAEGL
jgi:4-diphosphocytidyl-2-C-methyl-D-erythritol kinase